MPKNTISDILNNQHTGEVSNLQGWVRTFRSNRFIALNDGSCQSSIQCVVNFQDFSEDLLRRITTGSSISVNGEIVVSIGGGQSVEVKVNSIDILGDCPPDVYPIQPKRHSLEFLREKAHLRMRTSTFSAVMRIRHTAAFSVHDFFNQNGFFNLNTPIITASDAEGAGELFRVTTLPFDETPRKEDGTVDYNYDFFEKPTNLTVSGQLEGELGAMALGKIYTFGPTFRAENSNTTRHLSEFWMIEPEMAFHDLADNMDLAENLCKFMIKSVLEKSKDDLNILDTRLLNEEKSKPKDQRSELSLIEKLNFVLDNQFIRCSYTEAIEILMRSKPNKKGKFKFPITEWGVDLQSEHERYLVEKHFKSPVILFDYPVNIKAFYMRLNEDGKTVRAMDVLFPGIGEIAGGSQREERHDVLVKKMQDVGIDPEHLDWYLDSRKFGTCVHSGFGLGFERMVQFVTGMANIRDVIPFPRTPGNAEF
ncbi:MAG: Asparagine--tRNA ligase [Owenweeksia sp. TMED14]|nr:MAG: Asparagine--tRNA ligase [Owenweeksia sp. TMED14]|tara:strand:+ start:20702 stop:22135 length:1434 start_codon:yes stop_codon:yes gene_type:complete